jgi:hypothetical protein
MRKRRRTTRRGVAVVSRRISCATTRGPTMKWRGPATVSLVPRSTHTLYFLLFLSRPQPSRN